MTTDQFFETQLHVHFTREELSVIMSALAEYHFFELRDHRKILAEQAWKVREKVSNFCQMYDNSPLI